MNESPEITFESLKNDKEIRTYIEAGNNVLHAMKYTEHSYPHAFMTANTAANLLNDLGYSDREQELVKIAGLIHDIGNMINRDYHALTGGAMAYSLLDKRGMKSEEIAAIVTAIGNHDENTGKAVNVIAAALILADKSDVRRTRVTSIDIDEIKADIHNRVNYAVTNRKLYVSKHDEKVKITLELIIDTDFCAVMDYFEIFLVRMLMCGRAATFLGAHFELIINNQKIL